MVEKIKAFKAKDGRIFQNESEAINHELIIDLRRSFSWDVTNGEDEADFDSVIGWIAPNLTTLVIALGSENFVRKQRIAEVCQEYLQRPEATLNEAHALSHLTNALGVNVKLIIALKNN